MGGPREEEDYPDEVEERLVNEEYKIWKKNTPFLYGARELTGLNTVTPMHALHLTGESRAQQMTI